MPYPVKTGQALGDLGIDSVSMNQEVSRPVPSERYVIVAGETSRDCLNHTPDGLTEQ